MNDTIKKSIVFIVICVSIVLLGQCVKLIPEDSIEKLKYKQIDVVTPISKYFVYEKANGYGTITSYVDKSKNEDIKIQVEDLYLEPYFGWSDYCERFGVIKDNKYIGTLYLEVSKNENLQWGDVITVTPEFYPDNEEKPLEYFFEPVEIEVPDLGDYFAPSKFTDETLDSLRNMWWHEDELISVYYGELKPGYINPSVSTGCLIAIYGSWFSRGAMDVFFDVIVNSDGSIKSYDTVSNVYDALIYGAGKTSWNNGKWFNYAGSTSWSDVENAYNNAKAYYNLQCIYNG